MQRSTILVRNIGIALVGLWLAMAGYVLLIGLSGLITVHDYVFQPWRGIRSNTLYVWLPWFALTPLVMLSANRFPLRPDNWLRTLPVHGGIMVLMALAHGYAAALFYYNGGDVTPDMHGYAAWQHTGHFLFQDDMFLIDAFIYTVLAASQNTGSFYRLLRQRDLDAARMEAQVAESRLRALKMQINPHFLFNTLNSIAVLVKKQEADKASDMIERLSEFFRQTLEQGERQTVPLRQELALIEQYLAIEKIRFGDRLVVDYRVDPACLDVDVPALLLQPLAENAIKHGLAKKVGACRLQISAQRSPEGLLLQVMDDGAGTAAVAPTSGVGLRNVQDRLRVLYDQRHRFAFTSSPGVGTSVSIVLGGL
jgi:two-component system, LytTR family, sensor kinase